MLLHLNLCKSRPCLFLVFQVRVLLRSKLVSMFISQKNFSTQQLGENAPETADLYFSYGRALLENAIVQSSVLGKEQREDTVQEDSKGMGVFFYYHFYCNLGPTCLFSPSHSIRIWEWHKCSYSIVFWRC